VPQGHKIEYQQQVMQKVVVSHQKIKNNIELFEETMA
jgi:hypothetical protein